MKFLPCVFLALILFSLSPVASAQVEAEWWLHDTSTDQPALDLLDGTRINLRDGYHAFEPRNLGVRIYFSFVASSDSAHDYIDRVEWRVQHSGRGYVTAHISREPLDDGSWSMCGEERCRDLRVEGSIIISATAIYDDGGSPPVVAVVARDSRAFRILDTTPSVYVPTRRAPYCSGNRDKCNEIVGNAGLWSALKNLCTGNAGAEIALGSGATLNCP